MKSKTQYEEEQPPEGKQCEKLINLLWKGKMIPRTYVGVQSEKGLRQEKDSGKNEGEGRWDKNRVKE